MASIGKEWILYVLPGAVTLLIALLLIRWLAPQLLGLPTDLQLVQVDKKLPPFYEGVFRIEDYRSKKFILNDPITRVRARPGFPDMHGIGPNDMLGFRNRKIPLVADIVVIGDSQTYGNNVDLQDNWPEQMRFALQAKNPSLYAMATGGWGAVEYLDIADKAITFRPDVMIVAFYTGNDPMDSFISAYGNPHWKRLRPDDTLSKSDAPASKTSLSDTKAQWEVVFRDAVRTIFNPELRNTSNQPLPAVDAGYAIMTRVAQMIGKLASKMEAKVVFIIIPTKEFVYQDKIRRENIPRTDAYDRLIRNEKHRVDTFSSALKKIDGGTYVDVATPLRAAALHKTALYPQNVNGHPIAAGYKVIADTLAETVDKLLPKRPEDGLVAVKLGDAEARLGLVRNDTIRLFASPSLAVANRWDLTQPTDLVSVRRYETYDVLPTITEIDPEKYGPWPALRSLP